MGMGQTEYLKNTASQYYPRGEQPNLKKPLSSSGVLTVRHAAATCTNLTSAKCQGADDR